MDRRSFFKYSAGAMVGVSLLGRATSAFARDESSYSAVILGDTHYDAPDPEKYHAGYTDPNPTREANHRKEFKRNADMWDSRCPSLVKRAARLVGEDTRFVLQMGDLIQGDTATAAIRPHPGRHRHGGHPRGFPGRRLRAPEEGSLAEPQVHHRRRQPRRPRQ